MKKITVYLPIELAKQLESEIFLFKRDKLLNMLILSKTLTEVQELSERSKYLVQHSLCISDEATRILERYASRFNVSRNAVVAEYVKKALQLNTDTILFLGD